MGRGIDLAKTLSGNPEGVQALDDMKDQLIIVLLKKLGGWVELPVAELDDTGNDTMMMGFDPNTGVFRFEVRTE
jgi:hypothetical protein